MYCASAAGNLLGIYDGLGIGRLRDLARQFPAPLLLGARQVGKTTLARAAFDKARYVDLEEPRNRALFSADPAHQIQSLIESNTGPLILDEVQSVPELFGALRGLIDARRAVKNRAGRRNMCCSDRPSLH